MSATDGTLNMRGVFPRDLWDTYCEQFRGLRTRVNYAFEDEKHKIILVTSAVPREGKTMVSLNLARSLAQASRPTLIVDCDLRRSTVHTLFKLLNTTGLSDLLEKGGPPMEKVRKTDIPGLDVLPAGSVNNSPAELFLSDHVPSLLDELRRNYEYLILDAPPVLPVTDAVIMSRMADGILVVAQGGVTPREIVKEAVEQLRDGPLLGVVLNGLSQSGRHHSYYGYY